MQSCSNPLHLRNLSVIHEFYSLQFLSKGHHICVTRSCHAHHDQNISETIVVEIESYNLTDATARVDAKIVTESRVDRKCYA